MVSAADIEAAYLRGDPDVDEDDWMQAAVEEREHGERAADALTLYCLPRELGDPERVAAGLVQAAIAEGLAREDEEREAKRCE